MRGHKQNRRPVRRNCIAIFGCNKCALCDPIVGCSNTANSGIVNSQCTKGLWSVTLPAIASAHCTCSTKKLASACWLPKLAVMLPLLRKQTMRKDQKDLGQTAGHKARQAQTTNLSHR